MSIKRFIDRPLMSIVINMMVVAMGYPGASAETVQKSVVAPLEQAINGVDNMMYMTSSASNGSASHPCVF